MGAICLREYVPDDLDALCTLDDVCFAPPFRFSRASMRRFVNAKGAATVVAVDGVQVVGFCIVQMEGVRGRRVGYVVTLDVAPAYRRLGIAAALMQQMETGTRAGGGTALVLHVSTKNSAAVAFYERMGFETMQREKAFYGRGWDAIAYRKILTPVAGVERLE